uniref:phosphatidylinositol-3,5-bisphosphate 3-phosphatase n=1 Tax=Naja naja TaxID=35670 RepID=A0A8C6YFD0_NAJNA
ILECIQANQIFPRKQLIREDENLQVPFLELHGESTEYVGRADDAVIALSNYRLHIKFKESVVNVPLQLIESVECRDIFQLHLTCKDCKVIRCQFSTFEQCQEWLKRLNNAIRPPSKIEDVFSFAYHAWCMEVYASEKEQHGDLCRPGEHVTSRFKNEVERMGFDMNNAWRISNINEKYKLCSSYPQELIVPVWITDKELESVANFRSWKRIPVVVYRHQNNGAVISRCGQPEVSWWGWRNADDEHLVQSVAKACASDSKSSSGKLVNGNCSRVLQWGDFSDAEFGNIPPPATESLAIQPQKLLILDARSYTAAVANRAKGGGCECPEYYPNCEVVFMGMANIHSIRKSFQSLRLLCTQMPDPGNWLSALESTKWLQHLSVLLKSALLVVHAVDRDQRPVLVHCSDGWDRTPQIVALSKLLLDPYYRTVEGFQVLVEMEWLDFGHKFADRCGHGENSDDLNERCPVFLQWLDCVHQLQRQFPCSFEFNEAFLVKLVQHTYSCLFGTFLCNNAKERGEKHTQERTCSVWSLLRGGNKAFKNLLYSSQSESVLYPVCHVRNLMLWSAMYLPCSSPSTPVDDTCAPYPVPGSNPEDQPLSRLPKTRSFDNLTTACDSSAPTTNRRSSDPSLNEKWQEHRRSLELSNLGNPGDDLFEGESLGKQGRTLIGAELSVAVAEGQMENILQEATKEEGSLEENTRCSQERAGKEGEGDLPLDKEHRTEHLTGPATVCEKSDPDAEPLLDNPVSSQQVVSQGASELHGQEKGHPAVPCTVQKPTQGGELPLGFWDNPGKSKVSREEEEEEEEGDNTSSSSAEAENAPSPAHPIPPLPVGLEAATPNMESSTETLTETGVRAERAQKASSHWHHPADNSVSDLSQMVESRLEREDLMDAHKLAAALNRTPYSSNPSPCALPLTDYKEVVCNGDLKYSAPNGNLHHKWVQAIPGRQQTGGSPDQPARNHLDDDGMPIYADVIQQRLRQIESGHQQEVESLKKQVQELKSRLESQYLNSSLRFNGEYGDEVTSVPDSESNPDHNCLSRCSTEIFSEASWEQVDKQDTEVTRWLPDHLAAHCYGCDSVFWLVSRKHHCRNCGNVFCSSCCNQKAPVPSQQLFEPSRVCKTCYSSLHPSSASLDLELDKPIAATSN